MTTPANTPIWLPAHQEDHASIMHLCAQLYREDSSESGRQPIIAKTLQELAANPYRGRAVVLKDGARVCGYALLFAFWSNEFAGEVCALDELYVVPDCRSQGHGSALIRTLRTPRNALWPTHTAPIMLEVRPGNVRASALYERLGFTRNPNQFMLNFAEFS